MTRLRAIALLAAGLAAALAIGRYQLRSQRGGSSTSSGSGASAVTLFSGKLAPSELTLDQAVNPGPQDALLLGAGDIADCSDLTGAIETGNLIRRLLAKHPAAQVFTAGDNAYRRFRPRDFVADCYQSAWGTFNSQTAPAPGNHDYNNSAHDAAPYFAYFDYYRMNPAAKNRGYYSFDLKGWHIVSLNSDPHGGPLLSQAQWLDQDLDATDRRCILAVWHHPLFSSGDEHGADAGDPGRATGPFWDVLERHGADVVINGHDHHYERFAPQDSTGAPSSKGLRELIVGTGGAELRGLLSPLKAHSEAELTHRFGILALTLRPSSYGWAFLGTDGKIYDPSPGFTECHEKPNHN
jgi:hypothetical protein